MTDFQLVLHVSKSKENDKDFWLWKYRMKKQAPQITEKLNELTKEIMFRIGNDFE